ncbi:MAG: hypothetical protein BWY74_01361 [Firmicutes bacterium ADurb.Bin419]|nr:MAG: hypothetical protein BWY74_01361 [Firmicutes bacterium ADurb.Bin419]
MPDIRNCRRCKRLFNYIGGAPICHDCKQQDEVDYKRVKEYLYDHPKASIIEVSQELEVSVQQIKMYLKEGRLEIVGNDGNMILECERCGKSITTGRLCNDCSKEVSNDIKSTTNQMSKAVPTEDETTKRSNGMRYLNKTDQ